MSEESSADLDVEAAMREAMGFGNFATRRPKHQPETSLPQPPPPGTTQRPDHAHKTTTLPEFDSNGHNVNLNRNLNTGTSLERGNPSFASSNPTDAGTTTTGGRSTSPPSYAFSSPVSGTFYTSAELDEWARGKVNADGDVVYFKPGFITDDPWVRLRGRDAGMNGSGAERGGGREDKDRRGWRN